MIESITSGTYSYETQMKELSSASKTEKEQTQKDTAVVSSTQVPRTDTVTISEEGLKQVEMSAEAAKKTATSAATTDSTTSTQDLSSYTTAQLEDLVNDGIITQAEMNAELAKRAAEIAQTEMQMED